MTDTHDNHYGILLKRKKFICFFEDQMENLTSYNADKKFHVVNNYKKQ